MKEAFDHTGCGEPLSGLDRAELTRLMLETAPEDIAALLEEPVSLERLLAFAYIYASGGSNAFLGGLEQLRQRGLVRSGREVMPVVMSLDLCESVHSFVRILEELLGDELEASQKSDVLPLFQEN